MIVRDNIVQNYTIIYSFKNVYLQFFEVKVKMGALSVWCVT